MTSGNGATLTRVHNPLRKALSGSGLIGRDVALERSKGNIEGLRHDLVSGLKKEVAAVVTLAEHGRLTQGAVERGIVLAPVIRNLAGALGYGLLENVAASLHDLLAALKERGLLCAEPVSVHIHAVRLAAPGMPEIPPAAAQHLLAQLHAVVSRFRDAPLAQSEARTAPPRGP